MAVVWHRLGLAHPLVVRLDGASRRYAALRARRSPPAELVAAATGELEAAGTLARQGKPSLPPSRAAEPVAGVRVARQTLIDQLARTSARIVARQRIG